VKRGLLLNIVICKRTLILQLLAGKNKALLIRRDSLFVLNFLLDRLNRIRWLCIQRNGLSRQGLHENLHLLFVLQVIL
jgi:hypothetical protein